MSITTNDIHNITNIYIKENNNLKRIKKGCVIINGQIRYFYGMDEGDDIIAPGYRRLTHIINNKNANGYNETYIDTGISEPATIELKASVTKNLKVEQNNQRHYILYMGPKYYFYYRFNASNEQRMSGTLYVEGNSRSYTTVVKDAEITLNYNIDSDHTHETIIGSNEPETYTVSSSRWSIISSYTTNICLLGSNSSDNSYYTKQYPNTKLYSCKIWRDTEKTQLLREFVPAERISDHKYGLYDLAAGAEGQKFYTNAYPNSNIDFILDDSESDDCTDLDYDNCPTFCYTCTQCPSQGTCSCDTQCACDGRCGDNYSCECYIDYDCGCDGQDDSPCGHCDDNPCGHCDDSQITEISISEYHHVNSCPIRSGPGVNYSQIGSTAYNDNLYFSKRTSDYSWYYCPWSPSGWIYSGNLID